MTEYEAFEKQFTELTHSTFTENMREQFKQFSAEEIAAGLRYLHQTIVYKKRKLLNPFGYFCSMIFRQREQQASRNSLAPDDFSKACASFALELGPSGKKPAIELKEPHAYTDRQVLLLYLLLNGASFSRHCQSALLAGYTLPELPRYKAALVDFSNNRLPLLRDRTLVDECFKEAAALDVAEPRDFHKKLCMLLHCFSLGVDYSNQSH